MGWSVAFPSRRGFCSGLLALACAALGRPSAGAADAVALTQVEYVHPVLIRQEHNPFLRMEFDVRAAAPVQLQRLTFSLAGTTELRDVAAWELFSTADRTEFTEPECLGSLQPSATEVQFDLNQALAPGRHVFWLSCTLAPTADLGRRIAAQCSAATTSVGDVAPPNAAGISHRIGVALRRHGDDGVHTYRIPALARSSGGALLCVYDMRRRASRDLQEDIDIGLSRSTDGGQTWEGPRVILDQGEYGGLPQEQNGCSDPGIIVDQTTGEIFCFAVWMNGKPGQHQWTGDGSEPGYEIGRAAQLLLTRSTDDGQTWSPAENLTRALKLPEWWLLAPAPQQGICLADGALVMPCQGRDAQGVPFASILVSEDHGATWDVRAPACSEGNECQAAELGDGSLMLNIRNDRERFRAVYVTRDRGRTWEEHPTSRSALIEPNCNASLFRVESVQGGQPLSALLFSNPRSQSARTHQTIQVSYDDGRTWPAALHYLLDALRGAGYSSLAQVDARHVGIVYEGSQAHLVFERIPLTELLRDPP